MKLHRSKEFGGVLMVVLFTGMIVGITLGSYLQYTSTQTRSIKRSQAWNAAIPVAEAGVEEALAHINDSAIGTNFAINGWTVVSNKFRKEGVINGGRYVAFISTNALPVITSSGYTSDGRLTRDLARTVQATTTRYSTGMKGMVMKGNINMNGTTTMDSFDSEDLRYSTKGRYDPAKHKDGGYAASVSGNIAGTSITGNVGTGPNGTVTGTVGDFGWVSTHTGIQPGHYANDVNLSFPVVQPPFSGGGASSLGSGGVVSMTNYDFWATMKTTTNLPATPPASPIYTNVTGTMTVAWPTYPTGVLPSQVTTNYLLVTEKKNQPAPNVAQVVGGAAGIVNSGPNRTYTLITGYSYPSRTYTYSMTASNVVSSGSYHYILTADKYDVSSVDLANKRLLVTGTNVTLYIRGNFTMSGNGEIKVAPGASLKVYVAGNIDLTGNSGGGVFNYTMDPANLQIYGLPTCTSIAISGNASYTGIIYAPQANISLNGGGTDTYDVVGAIVGNTATLNGHFQFHYDEALGRAKIQSKYNVASWAEL